MVVATDPGSGGGKKVNVSQWLEMQECKIDPFLSHIVFISFPFFFNILILFSLILFLLFLRTEFFSRDCVETLIRKWVDFEEILNPRTGAALEYFVQAAILT